MIIAGVLVIYAALVLFTALPIVIINGRTHLLKAFRFAALCWLSVALVGVLVLIGGAMIYEGVKP